GAWADWTAQPALLVDVESHGREAIADDVDLSDTVGWFTSMYPVAFDLTRTKTVGDQLKRVKEQLRRVPQGGLSYGLLRYLGPDPALRRQLEAIPTPDVSFNFLGQFDGVFSGQLLTPPQQGMLLHTLAAPRSGTYFEQIAWKGHGRFDPALFIAAWQRAVARHQVLRTSFHTEGLDKPLQVVHRTATVPVTQEDWRG